MSAAPTDLVDREAEFDKCAEELVQNEHHDDTSAPTDRSKRGPRPSITAATIYEHALSIVDAEGLQCLTARRLASRLEISTRTLYKRIGNHDNLIRGIMDLHLSRLAIDVVELSSWEKTAWNWCRNLHATLCEYANLTYLMTDEDLKTLDVHVTTLADIAARSGVEHLTALAAARALLAVTTNDALRKTLSAERLSALARSHHDGLISTAPDLFRAIHWILVGVSASVAPAPPCSRDDSTEDPDCRSSNPNR